MLDDKKIVNNITAGYKGTVSVKIQDESNNILYSTQSHNKGCKTLFRFLCECLAGDYVDADKFRPIKVIPYNFDGQVNEAIDNFNMGEFGNQMTALTGPIVTDTRAKVVSDDSGFSVVFHFTIPFAYLNSLEKEINVMMLYPSTLGVEVSGNLQEPLAYYLFIDKEDKTKWAPIKLSEFESKENTNLIIEWKMSILNID